MTTRKIITIFGSGLAKEGSEVYRTAHDLGKRLAAAGYEVCNGGYGGTMEASARGAKEVGGTTIGVVTQAFGTNANPYIDKTIITRTHSERLVKLIELGDAYVVLRGGTGTLVELATVWEYMNKGMLSGKPFVVLGGFWKNVIETIDDEMKREGKAGAAGYVTPFPSPKECLAFLNKRLK